MQIVGEMARIAFDVGQPLEAVAHHEAHRSRVPIGPDALGAVRALGRQEFVGDDVERLVPANGNELARTPRPDAAERLRQAVGMVGTRSE